MLQGFAAINKRLSSGGVLTGYLLLSILNTNISKGHLHNTLHKIDILNVTFTNYIYMLATYLCTIVTFSNYNTFPPTHTGCGTPPSYKAQQIKPMAYQSTYHIGDVVKYRCEKGPVSHMATSLSLCQQDGTWSRPSMQCEYNTKTCTCRKMQLGISRHF